MNCPVCGKEARAKVYWCAKCAELVHTACWPKHQATAHTEMPIPPRSSSSARRVIR